jgi:hypothetical protein
MGNGAHVFRARTTHRCIRRISIAMLGAVLVVLAGATIPAAAQSSSSPEQVLQKAEKFLKKAKTVQYTAALQTGGADVGTYEQTAQFPAKGQALLVMASNVVDSVYIGDRSYFRAGPSEAAIADLAYDPQYGRSPEFSIFERPQDLVKLVGELENPQIVSDGPDGTVVRADFSDPAKVIRATDNPYTSAHVDITVAKSGEPTKVVLTASGPDGEVTATSGDITWNGKVTVPTPATKDSFDKQGLAAYKDAKLYQPTAIPKAWKFHLANILPAAVATEGCDQAHIAYADPKNPEQEFLELYEFPTSCAQEPTGGEPFALGSHQGVIGEGNGLTFVQVDLDGTTIQVNTNLSRDQLQKILATPAAFAFNKPPKSTL